MYKRQSNAQSAATAASQSQTASANSATASANSASAASGSATEAESYARGGTGSRAGEDTDNAKYYYEKAKNTEIGKVSEEVAGLSNDVGVLSARLDNISSLPEGSTTADAELMDIRVGADGTTYDSAGAAVRAQFDAVNTHLSNADKDISELNAKKITKFYASNLGNTTVNDSDSGKITDMLMYGKSEQKQYSGKNLINISRNTTNLYAGFTIAYDIDGKISITGSGDPVWIYYINGLFDASGVSTASAIHLESGTYYVSGFSNVRIVKSDGTVILSGIGSFTLSSEEDVYVAIVVNNNMLGTYAIQLEKLSLIHI